MSSSRASRFQRNLLRDVFVLTLPVAALLCFVAFAAAMSFYRAEIACFHGYPVRAIRAGGLKAALYNAVEPLQRNSGRRYRPTLDRLAAQTDGPRAFDLRIGGIEMDELRSDLPGSAKSWVSATLGEGGKNLRVDTRNRGQRMVNYFWNQKAWKIRTAPTELVDGYRDINLSPVHARLDGHLTYLLARELGMPASRSRVVKLYLNEEDQGLYLQEEQVDETLVRRYGRMPGDIFYGELFVPDEPTMSADDLFWNPFLWRKKAVHNYFGDEHRPYLTAMLDAVTSDESWSWDRLYELLDYDAFVTYYALLSHQGDQHIDHSHNHKLYFSPISGKFEPLIWNPLINMPAGRGVESIANRLFYKFARDPRFLDDVQRKVRDIAAGGALQRQLAEVERIRSEYRDHALDRPKLDRALDALTQRVTLRSETVAGFLDAADLWFEQGERANHAQLDVWVRAAASLRLTELRLERARQADDPAIVVWEDRDFSGTISPADRRVATRVRGDRVVVEDQAALLYPGRDFRASYAADVGETAESFATHRGYTRLAPLRSRLLVAAGPGSLPRIVGLGVERTVAAMSSERESVTVESGAPAGYVATKTMHPWRMPSEPSPRRYDFSGNVKLHRDLVVHARDELSIADGTTFELDPGVSIVLHTKVELRDVTFVRSDNSAPWGVVALQGQAAAGSVFERCRFFGGSHGIVDFIYYSGMVSVHEADNVTMRDCTYGPNVLGDDTLRYARCEGVLIFGVTIQRANGDAIDCDQCRGRIERVTITEPRNDAIDLMTADVDVHAAQITGAGDKGISFGEGANPLVTDTTISKCVLGLGLKDTSDPILRNVTIEKCGAAIASYDKNWRYPGGGRGRLIDCRLEGNDVDVRMDARSQVVFVGCELEGNYDLPANADPARILVLTEAEARERANQSKRFAELFSGSKN